MTKNPAFNIIKPRCFVCRNCFDQLGINGVLDIWMQRDIAPFRGLLCDSCQERVRRRNDDRLIPGAFACRESHEGRTAS